MSTQPHAHPLPSEPTQKHTPLTRADWIRIAIFGIPYAAFFLFNLIPASIMPESWSATLINIALDSIFLILALAFFGREFISSLAYMRTHPIRKIATLFALWFGLILTQSIARLAIYGLNPPVVQNQQNVIDALYDGASGIIFSFFVAIGVPIVEEIFYRHILIGKLSAYAPTWLLATISAILFAAMHCHQWQDLTAYLPIALVITVLYVRSGKNVGYSWILHALNNSIMVGLIYLVQHLQATT